MDDPVSRQELLTFLTQQIAEQKRIDAGLSGVPSIIEGPQSAAAPKEANTGVDVQLVLPTDAKKQRKQTKQMFLDRGKCIRLSESVHASSMLMPLTAFDYGVQLKNTLLQSGMPVLGIDVPTAVFDGMSKASAWLTDEDAWKTLLSEFSPQHTSYAHQIRDSVQRRKDDGLKFLILFAVREERAALLTLS